MEFKTKIKNPSFIVLAISLALISLIAFTRNSYQNLKADTFQIEPMKAIIELR